MRHLLILMLLVAVPALARGDAWTPEQMKAATTMLQVSEEGGKALRLDGDAVYFGDDALPPGLADAARELIRKRDAGVPVELPRRLNPHPGATPKVVVAAPVSSDFGLTVTAPPENDGLNLKLAWTAPTPEPLAWAVLRGPSADGPWTVVTADLPGPTLDFSDKVTTDVEDERPRDSYWYRVVALRALPPEQVEGEDWAATLLAMGAANPAVEGRPIAVWFKTSPGSLMLLALILGVGAMMLLFTRQARQGKEMSIRRIPGIDAIEEGIGRATEMGKPVLYVPGIDELQDIQTIASMLILGQVSKTVAEYQTDIIVSCCIPIVREVADEVVKAGFYQAGHPDAYRPHNTRFISSEQFAFCAGTNGIIHREKPATNLYLGRFFAESLILAETGFVNKSIQIAGTAEATQLPFFIAACDYTLIGEELFAVSAYLSGDPRLVSSLKASDYVKVFCIAAIVVGTVTVTLGSSFVQTLFTIAGG